MWVSLAGAAVVTIVLTFLVPVIQKPRLTRTEE
jgi:hypothetical protein